MLLFIVSPELTTKKFFVKEVLQCCKIRVKSCISFIIIIVFSLFRIIIVLNIFLPKLETEERRMTPGNSG